MTTFSNPWLGLMTYEEGQPLYGRTEEIKTLSSYILQSDQTIVYGRSGIGKSSLLNAGIFPIVRRQGYYPVNIRLQHHSSVSYLDQIDGVLRSQNLTLSQLVPPIEGHEETLWEYFHRHLFRLADGTEVKPLIVLDQFEEIFTLAHDKSRVQNFFQQLADLLNHVTPEYVVDAQSGSRPALELREEQSQQVSVDDMFQLDASFIESMSSDSADYLTESNFHVVIVIREDYLAFLEHATARIPSLKYNRYFLQPINEEQALEIITYPRPGLVSQDVARLIIESITNRTDFTFDGHPEIPVDSAVLSLFLERLCNKMTENGDSTITAELISQYGGDIIEDYYLSSVKDLPAHMVEFMEDQLITADGHRENVAVANATKQGGLSPEFISLLCGEDEHDRTRRLLRRFNYAGADRIEFLHDILCPVIMERRQQREEARRLAQIKEAAERERRRMRRTANILIGSLLGLVTLALGIYFSYFYVYASDFETLTLINGWPVGIRPLKTTSHSPLYYRLTRQGLFGPYTDVEICSSNSRLPLTPRLNQVELYGDNEHDLAAQRMQQMMSEMTHLHFEANAEGQINREVIMKGDSTLFVIGFFHLDASSQAWVNFMTARGRPMQIRDNGVDRMKLRWDEEGRISEVMFFDADGICLPVADGVQAFAYRNLEDGTTMRYELNEYGRMIDNNINVTSVRYAEDSIVTTYGHALLPTDTLPSPILCPEGWARCVETGDERTFFAQDLETPIARQKIERDKHGNITEERVADGALSSIVPPLVRYEYDDQTGYPTSLYRLNTDGKPFSNRHVYHEVWNYDDEGTVTLHERHTADRKIYERRVEKAGNVTTTTVRDLYASIPCLVRVDSVLEDATVTCWYADKNKPINYAADKQSDPYHRRYLKRLRQLSIPTLSEQMKYQQVDTRYFIVDDHGLLLRRPNRLDSVGIARSWYRDVQTFDADNNLVVGQRFGADDQVLKSMIYYYQNGQHVARAVMGVDGTPVRCPNWEEDGFAYYKIFYSVNFKGRFVSVSPVDEWNRPSVFYDPVSGYQRVDFTDMFGWEARSMDNPDVFMVNDHYKQFVFRSDSSHTDVILPYLHILDRKSPLYEAGLRDGDRLTAVGEWRYGMQAGEASEALLVQEWTKLSKKGGEVTARRPEGDGFQEVRFRVAPSQGVSLLAEYHLLALSPSELQYWQKP